MAVPNDYLERVYAGVLGKIIGVYLGRPFEGWTYDRIMADLGCLLGIKNRLAAIDAGPDWRGPVADRLYLSTAEGSRGISDAVTESMIIVNSGYALAGQAPPPAPKHGARFHFELPGSVQGFTPEDSPDVRGVLTVENVAGHSSLGTRSLALRYRGLAPGRSARVSTPTFIPSRQIADYFIKRGYTLYASPTLYAGQTVTANVLAGGNTAPVECGIYIAYYQDNDDLGLARGPKQALGPNQAATLTWTIPDLKGLPIAAVGVEISPAGGTDGTVSSGTVASGTVYLDSLSWSGAPQTVLANPGGQGVMWRRAWVNGVDQYEDRWWEAYRLVQNSGRGIFSQGGPGWTDYRVSAPITLHMAATAGLAARVQGMRRYYALLLRPGKAQLVKALDGDTVLAEADLAWEFTETHEFSLEVKGAQITGFIDGRQLFSVRDEDHPLSEGGVALVVEEGRIMCEQVAVGPANA